MCIRPYKLSNSTILLNIPTMFLAIYFLDMEFNTHLFIHSNIHVAGATQYHYSHISINTLPFKRVLTFAQSLHEGLTGDQSLFPFIPKARAACCLYIYKTILSWILYWILRGDSSWASYLTATIILGIPLWHATSISKKPLCKMGNMMWLTLCGHT